MKKITFEEFLTRVYNMNWAEYDKLNDYQQKALVIQWKDNYK